MQFEDREKAEKDAARQKNPHPLRAQTLKRWSQRSRAAKTWSARTISGAASLLLFKGYGFSVVFAQSRTLRIRQLHGLDFSTADSTSPHRAVAILPLSDFHELSRAAGPKGQLKKRERGTPSHQ